MDNNASSKILVVEDDNANIVYLAYMLKKLNVDYTTVPSGIDALRVINDFNPALVLIDISLTEDMSGIDLVKELNADDKYAKIPKIAMSAHITAENKDEYIGYGFSDCLKKPFSLEDLSAITDKYF